MTFKMPSSCIDNPKQNKADPKLRSCGHMSFLVLCPRLTPRRVTQQVSALSFVFQDFLIIPRNIRGSGQRSADHPQMVWDEGTHTAGEDEPVITGRSRSKAMLTASEII